MSRWREYYQLAKPGIIRGNLLAALAGYFVIACRHPYLWQFIGLLLGLGLVIGSACAANNYLDRHIDAKMQRTKQRALVTGSIRGCAAIGFSIVLGVSGVGMLLSLTNVLAATIAVAGWLGYVYMYGYAKRRTTYSTLVGCLPGAVPPVVGYTTFTGRLDLTALLLFAILICWQLPHFFAIAIFRQADYQAADIPLMPARRGFTNTRWQIVSYIGIFCLLAPLLAATSPAGWLYALVIGCIAVIWLAQALRPALDTTAWSRRVFGWSLLTMAGWSGAILISALFTP